MLDLTMPQYLLLGKFFYFIYFLFSAEANKNLYNVSSLSESTLDNSISGDIEVVNNSAALVGSEVFEDAAKSSRSNSLKEELASAGQTPTDQSQSDSQLKSSILSATANDNNVPTLEVDAVMITKRDLIDNDEMHSNAGGKNLWIQKI